MGRMCNGFWGFLSTCRCRQPACLQRTDPSMDKHNMERFLAPGAQCMASVRAHQLPAAAGMLEELALLFLPFCKIIRLKVACMHACGDGDRCRQACAHGCS